MEYDPIPLGKQQERVKNRNKQEDVEYTVE
jgi:hypothetical protein